MEACLVSENWGSEFTLGQKLGFFQNVLFFLQSYEKEATSFFQAWPNFRSLSSKTNILIWDLFEA